MSRNFSFSTGEYYHCYSRGTEKRKIFLSRKDYERFIALLFVCNSTETIHLSDHWKKSFNQIFNIPRSETIVDIGAYSFMPNHFHLLLREKKEDGISLFMQKLITAYTMYFNKKYNRTGALFESRFKAEHANKDKYLKYLFSYMHLNPEKLMGPAWKEGGGKNIGGAKKFLGEYTYSSYSDYSKKESRPQGVLLNKNSFSGYFIDIKDFGEEMLDWLNVKVEP